MTRPALPTPPDGEVLLISNCYEDGKARWGELLDEIGGRRDGDVLAIEGSGVRLRPAENTGWQHLNGGNLPALVQGGGPPVIALADIPVVYGGAGPLLIDLATMPGRGVRVRSARLGEVLTALLGGTLTFDHLVRDMDVSGVYRGNAGRPAFTAPEQPSRRTFPDLPSTEGALLVRTSFEDEEAWQALLAESGGADEDGVVGADLDWDDIDVENFPLTALVVDDRAFEDLHPGQVPALVPPGKHTTCVALADTRTFTQPGRPLTVVDLYETPGQPAVLPWRMVGSMACNLDIANMDFSDFVIAENTEPWWGAP